MQQHTENQWFGSPDRTVATLLIAWFFLNVLQAALTSLTADEAYYWMYANHLDWGYFDHPPMVALFIRLGMWIPGELGPRLGSALGQAVGLWLIWKTAKRISDGGSPKPWLFFALAFGIYLLQPFGFISTPDAPLLFFSALFFWGYYRFIEYEKWTDVVLLAIVCAGLLYSKYHGILLIGFTILSNPRLLLQARFYAVAVLATILFLPHIYWQVEHDWISFRYHLVERNDPFRAWYVLEFFLNMLLVFNPFFWYFLFKIFRKPAWNDPFLRGLLIVSWGFFGFFLLSSLRGHIQPQWLVIISFPFLLLLYQRYQAQNRARLWLTRIGLYGIPVLLLARVVLMFPALVGMDNEFARNPELVEAFQKQTGERTAAFGERYQDASLYGFYAQKPETYSASLLHSRRTQFDLWQLENQIHLQPVYWFENRFWSEEVPKDEFAGVDRFHLAIDTFYAFQKVAVKILESPQVGYRGRSLPLRLKFENPYPHALPLSELEEVRMHAYFWNGTDLESEVRVEIKGILPDFGPNESLIRELELIVPGDSPVGAILVGFTLQYFDLHPYKCAQWVEMEIKE